MEGIPWRLAIDFGTSNTAAAVVRGGGGVHVLRLGARSDAIPSCVAAYNGEILTGDAALQISGIYPSAFEPTPKRRLGEDAVVLGGSVFDPVDLVAAVIGFVARQATRFVGGDSPSQVVLTHPEAWDEYMKWRLTAAALKAGIPEQNIVLLPEPVAAGWHYAAGSDVDLGAHVAVLDFGGGTCDAAVLELAQTPAGPLFRVVASGGIDPLGGHDFDAQLENWVYAQLAAEGKTELLQSLKSERASADRAVLRDQVREAKHALSYHGSAPIGVRSGDHEWVCTATRGEFEQLIDGQIRRAVELVQRVIQEALPSAQQLHRVYLTGGSSHIPALQATLGEILPMKLGLMGDPKQITSIGALQAPAPSGRAAAVEQPAAAVEQPIAVVEPLVADAPAARREGRKPWRVQRVQRKVWIGGSAGAAALLLIGTIALATGRIMPTPPPTTSTSGTPQRASRLCAGEERARLSDGECSLLTTAVDRRLVDPDSCTAIKSLELASSGLNCNLPAGSSFNSSERPTINVYGYSSVGALNKAFDGVVNEYGAAERSVAVPPAWQDWVGGDGKTVRGRILGASKDGTNYLIWNDAERLLEVRADSTGADVPALLEWWKALPQ
ncbi:hypothetical protein JOE31_001286 [Arthrobacter sp. PvP023]|uniref:Hsp70 family protein n=1 Tax=Micrococcaceae TaxID=1268 RepID=UPI001AE5D930|nr:Hsp70 family protein [Arthrobacter sp. PvP023]MBP1135054.1 hypothetical protein [Arthrobacter sp. PvP023]